MQNFDIEGKRPYPPVVNRIFEMVFYESNFNEAEKLYKTLSSTKDKIYALPSVIVSFSWISEDEKVEYYLEELKTYTESKNLDPIDKIHAKFNYLGFKGFFLSGVNNPELIIDQARNYIRQAIELAKDYLKLLQNTNPDLFHRTSYLVYTFKSLLEDDLETKANLLYQSIDHIKKLSVDNDQLYVHGGYPSIAFIREQQGRFDEAYQLLTIYPKVITPLYDSMLHSNLAYLEWLKGNIAEAIVLSEKSISLGAKRNFNWSVYRQLTNLATYVSANGEYNKAKKYLYESLDLRKKHSNPIEPIMGYYYLIRFLEQQFQLSNDKNNLIEAQKLIEEAGAISSKFSSNPTVVNYVKLSKALLDKHGRLSQKNNSYNVIKSMITRYPSNINLKLDLVELLIDEAKISDNEEIITEIDDLIESIQKLGLYKIGGSPTSFINIQILVARYQYYIKENVKEGISTLEQALELIEKFNLAFLNNKITNEIAKMTNEMKRFENQDVSDIKEKLSKQELRDYLILAKNMQGL